MRLPQMKSKSVMNLMRGIQGKDASNEVIRALNTIRTKVTPEDAGAVVDWLYDSNLYTGLALPAEFPRTPVNHDRYIALAQTALSVEVAMLKSRQQKHEDKIVGVIDMFREHSNLLNAKKYAEAVDLLDQIQEKYGYSIRLLLKYSYIYSHPAADNVTQARSKAYLDLCGMAERNFIARGAIDIMSADYSFLSIRRSIATRGAGGGRSQFTNDIGEWLFFPYYNAQDTLSAQLRSQRQASLIDATFTLLENTLNLDNGERFSLRYEEIVASEKIATAWKKLSDCDLQDLIERSKKEQDHSFKIYRDSISKLENRKISEFRIRTDSLYKRDATSPSISSKYANGLNKNYYQGITSLCELCTKSDESATLLAKFDTDREGVFGRTLAAKYVLSQPLTNKTLNTDELLVLMNLTRDMDELLEERHLDLMLDVGDVDELFRMIILTLKAQHSNSPRAKARLRKSFEALVIGDFNGNIIDLLTYLADKAPAVSKYLFEICDESFLDLLYDLIPQGTSVLHVRSSILNWYAEQFQEKAYADRARMMQIDERIQRVRGTIDDTRIYVDKVRFLHWLQDNYLSELNAIYREDKPEGEELQLDGISGQEQNPSPAVRMAKLLQAAFSQFCENTQFGIAAYLGRRIRHGTLSGVLNSKVEELIAKGKKDVFEGSPQIGLSLDKWLQIYRDQVDELVKSYIQVYTPKHKPKGLIQTNIWTGRKLATTQGCLRLMFDKPAEESGIDAMHRLLQSCWRIIQDDLDRIRRQFVTSRINWGTLEAQDLTRNSPTHRAAAGHFCAQLNLLTDELFKTVSNWFHQPQDMVPSAPLALLFDAVVKEVQEAFPHFDPLQSIEGLSDIVLTGGTYHIVYDALFILLGNAARHGHPTVEVVRKFDFVAGRNSVRELLVSVSCSADPEQLLKIDKAFSEALFSDNSRANDFEKGSGFKKLVHLRDTSKEFLEIRYSVENQQFRVDMFFEMLA